MKKHVKLVVCGISRGLLSTIENGKGNPSLLTIHKLGAALGHHPCDLLAA